jgi:CRISPR-associated endonuclease/helicase Cas3
MALLAKSKPKRSLRHHTLDVLSMAREYATRWPHLAELAGDPHLFDDLILAALLHDLGKAASGFQALLRGERDESWQRYRHEILSGAITALLPDTPQKRDLLLVVMTHHLGMNDDLSARRSLQDYDPQNDRLTSFDERKAQLRRHWHDLRSLMNELRAHLPEGTPWPELPDDPQDLPEPFATLRSLSSGTTRRRSRQAEAKRLPLRAIALRGLLVGADHLASAAITEENAHLDDIVSPLPSIVPVTPESFPFTLNAHQQACAAAHGSIFLSAPTGSGKTEAALLWAQRNQAPNNTRHLFYVLPFTASINAMYHRLKDKHFGEDAVSLLHGRSSYFAYRWLCESDPDIDPKEAAKRVTAARRQTKELYYPVKVLTPHQILMAFLGVKGWEKSLCEYAGGLFILDEIHAYEPKLTGLLFEILRRLTQELGAKVCVMSATFPSRLKAALKEHLEEASEVGLEPPDRARYTRHFIRVVEGSIADELDDIRKRLHRGERVLVVLNTVAGAMACFEALKDDAQNPCLVHGRLIQRDRQEAEDRLADKRAPVDLLIGTQAIEVSLDVDFDVLYSDPAPLDALLQRFGRVNRKPLHVLDALAPDARYRDVIVCREQWPDSPRIYDRDETGQQLIARTLESLPSDAILDESKLSDLIDTVYSTEQLQEFLNVAQKQADLLRQITDRLEPGSEHPSTEDTLLDDLIDSIPIVPIRFLDDYRACFEEGRFFDAQDYVFNITRGRYHMLKKLDKLQSEKIRNQTLLFGRFPYEDGMGPDFEGDEYQEALIL